MVTATLDKNDKLKAYAIRVNTPRAMPNELQRHIDEVVMAPREPSSPAAKLLYEYQPMTENEYEQNGIRILESILLFTSEKFGGERDIWSAGETPLSSAYLPDACSREAKARWGKLSQCIPDSVIGYIHEQKGSKNNVSHPFTAAQECVVVSPTSDPSYLNTNSRLL